MVWWRVYVAGRDQIKHRLPVVTAVLFCLCVAYCHFLWLDHKQPPPAVQFNKNTVLSGVISALPNRLHSHTQFLLRTAAGTIKLTWYHPRFAVKPNTTWHLIAKLKHARGLANPAAPDHSAHEKQAGIIAHGYVVKVLAHRPMALDWMQFREHILQFRYRLQQRIEAIQINPALHPTTPWQKLFKAHSPAESQAIKHMLTALTLGDNSHFSDALNYVLRQTGTSHLMAISGMHVGLVLFLLTCLLQGSLRLMPRLLNYCPAHHLTPPLLIAGLWGYGLLMGLSFSTERAVMMFTLLLLFHYAHRPIGLVPRILIAFLIIVMLQPVAVFSAGFWCSFIATYLIASELSCPSASRLNRWFRLQCKLTLALSAVSCTFFYQTSLLSLATNAIAIPVVTLLVVPCCLLGTLGLLVSHSVSHLFFLTAAYLLTPLYHALTCCADLPFSVYRHPVHHGVLLVIFLIGFVHLLSHRHWLIRCLGYGCLLPLICYRPSRPEAGDLWATTLDVGQGLAVLLQTQHHTLLYDAGPAYPEGFDAGRSVILPTLRYQGIGTVDHMMISHGDNDHIGGSYFLSRYAQIHTASSSLPHSPRWYLPYRRCEAGQAWSWDGVDFKVLWPRKGLPYDANNSSCVLRIEAGKSSLLLTGDVEAPGESALLKQGMLKPTDVVIVPHHGSKTSSTPGFVDTVKPAVAVFSLGYHNRYHHPSPSVVKRYHALGTASYFTDRSGAITVKMKSDGSRCIRTTRQAKKGEKLT